MRNIKLILLAQLAETKINWTSSDNQHSKSFFQNEARFSCQSLLTIYFPISSFIASLADGDWCIRSSAFNLPFLLPDREVLLLLPSGPSRPAQPVLKTLWCVTSHLTLKAVKSQFSDKSNLNLSGDTIFRSDRDRAACVAIILYKHFEANATFVKSVSGAVLLDLPDKGNRGNWMQNDAWQHFYFAAVFDGGPVWPGIQFELVPLEGWSSFNISVQPTLSTLWLSSSEKGVALHRLPPHSCQKMLKKKLTCIFFWGAGGECYFSLEYIQPTVTIYHRRL